MQILGLRVANVDFLQRLTKILFRNCEFNVKCFFFRNSKIIFALGDVGDGTGNPVYSWGERVGDDLVSATLKYQTPAAGNGENGYGHNPNSLTMAQTPGGPLTVFAANEYWGYGAVQQFEWKSAALTLKKS